MIDGDTYESTGITAKLHQQLIAHVAQHHIQIRNETELAVELRRLIEQNARIDRANATRLRIQEEQRIHLQAEVKRLEQDQEASRIAEQRAHVEAVQEAEARRQEARRLEISEIASQQVEPTPSPSVVEQKPPPSTVTPQERPTDSRTLAPAATGTDQAGNALEAAHNEYLEIHRHLKQLRQMIKDFRKELPNVADLRREITKTISQYGIGSSSVSDNKKLNAKLRNVFTTALANPGPRTVDIRLYIRHSLHSSFGTQDFQAPLLWVYCVHMLCKKAVGYFADNCRSAIELAEPVGVALANLFCREPLTWKGVSMFDMFIAKYHKAAPLLFGINGDQTTVKGRQRLGWRTEGGPTNFIDERDHYDRMTGLGSGFAAISLRDFSNVTAAVQAPFPHANFWRAVAYMINTPAQEITPTHYVLMKAILTPCLPRLIKLYGKAGKALLHEAVIQFPKKSPKGAIDELAIGVTTLREEFLEKYQLVL